MTAHYASASAAAIPGLPIPNCWATVPLFHYSNGSPLTKNGLNKLVKIPLAE